MTYNYFVKFTAEYAECYIEVEVLGHKFKGKLNRVLPLITSLCTKELTPEDTPKSEEYLRSCDIIKCWEECSPAHTLINMLKTEVRYYPKEEHPEFDYRDSYRISEDDPALYHWLSKPIYEEAKYHVTRKDRLEEEVRNWKDTRDPLIVKFLIYTDTDIIFYDWSDEMSTFEYIPRYPYTELI